MAINSKLNVHKLIVCANMFVKKGDRYLLIKRSAKKKYNVGFVNPIGGKVDVGEDPMVAAQREAMEEAGVKVKNIKLEAVITEIKPEKERKENWLVFHFSGEYESGELKKCDEGEFIWFDKDDIPAQNLYPSVKQVIKYILNEDKGTAFASFTYKETESGAKLESLNLCKAG